MAWDTIPHYIHRPWDPTEVAWDTIPHYIHRPWTLQKWPETQYLTTYIGPGTLQKWPETQYLTTHTGPWDPTYVAWDTVPHYIHRPWDPTEVAWDTDGTSLHTQAPGTLHIWPETQYLTTYTGPGPYKSGLRHRWYLTTHTVQALDSTEIAKTQMVPHYTHSSSPGLYRSGWDTDCTSLHTQFKPWTLQKWLRHRWCLTTHTGPYRGGLWHRQYLTTHIVSWALEKRSANTGRVYPTAKVPQNSFSCTYYTGLQWRQATRGSATSLVQPLLWSDLFFSLSLSPFSVMILKTIPQQSSKYNKTVSKYKLQCSSNKVANCKNAKWYNIQTQI